jgi:molybdopterin converting factor subunit 1
MQIDVLFFASYRELAGADRRSVTLSEGGSARDLVRELRALGDGLAALPESAAVVVNQRVVRPDHPIAPDDEVALLPPVAGG